MKVTPCLVASVLTTLVTCTCTSYIFFPEEFGKSGPGYRRGGYWGPVDAIHDWCEVNYQSSSWVAEPWNTASSLSYFVPALTLLLFPVPAMDTRFLVLGGILVAVGAGSMLFHASMRYGAQLLDELPMKALTLAGGLSVWYRNAKQLPRVPCAVTAVYFSVIVLVLFAVDRTQLLHTVTHDFMSVVFSVLMVFILTSGSRVAGEAADMAEAGRDAATAASVEHVAGLMFIEFVLAIIGWVLDNFFCPTLQALPMSLPYPQLHAVVWHGGTALGCYGIVVILMTHRALYKGQTVRISWMPCGLKLFPLVSASEGKSL